MSPSRPAVLAVPLVLVALACGGETGLASGREPQQGAPLVVVPVLPSKPWSGLEEPARLVLRDAASWAAAWADLWAGSPDAPPVPAVDFSRDVVVVAALGTRASSGYSVEIAGAVREGAVRVEVLERAPGAGCGTATVLTQPVTAARVAAAGAEIVFDEALERLACE